MLLAILALVFIGVIVIYLIHFSRLKPDNFPPGPPRLPLWGSYWFLLKENYNLPHLALQSLGKKYKTDILGFYLGDTPAITVFSNKLNKELLTKEEFIGRNDGIINRGRSLGQLRGIFFVDGPLWKLQRRFSLRHMRDFGFGRRHLHIENFITGELRCLIEELLREPTLDNQDAYRAKGEALFPDIIQGLLLNTIFLVLTGTKFKDKELRGLGRAALRFQRSGDVTGCAITMTPWLRYIAPDFFGYTPVIKDNGILLSFLKATIEQHKRTFSDDHHRDYIDVYISEQLRLQEEGSDISMFTDEQLLITMLDYMFPAAIAIGHTLSFYFAHVVNNPGVQSKIQEEIDTVVGFGRLPNLDDRKHMPYLEASIRENLRILPLNPLGIARRCVEDTEFAGYFIPKDTVILPCVWTAHRDDSLWDRTDEFLPERFLDERGKLLKKDYTLGFGAGKRLCAGETFARNNMFLIVSTLLQQFHLTAANGTKIDLDLIVPGVNISIDNNWIRLIPRS